MTEKTGFDQPPPYTGNTNPGFSNQYGADFGQGGAYPQGGGAYPQGGGAYPQAGGAYPPPGGAYAGQGGYGQAVQQQSTTAVIINQPGAAGQVVVRPRPPDYMVASVLACLFCFWPTGLCAIYYASQASKMAAVGDTDVAYRFANNARNLMISSIVIGVIWITLVIVLRVVVYSTTTCDPYDYNC